MFSDYLKARLAEAHYQILASGQYFGEVPSCPGVWATASNLEACRTELQEVLEEWVLLKIRDGEKVPQLGINFDRRDLVAA